MILSLPGRVSRARTAGSSASADMPLSSRHRSKNTEYSNSEEEEEEEEEEEKNEQRRSNRFENSQSLDTGSRGSRRLANSQDRNQKKSKYDDSEEDDGDEDDSDGDDDYNRNGRSRGRHNRNSSNNCNISISSNKRRRSAIPNYNEEFSEEETSARAAASRSLTFRQGRANR